MFVLLIHEMLSVSGASSIYLRLTNGIYDLQRELDLRGGLQTTHGWL